MRSGSQIFHMLGFQTCYYWDVLFPFPALSILNLGRDAQEVVSALIRGSRQGRCQYTLRVYFTVSNGVVQKSE